MNDLLTRVWRLGKPFQRRFLWLVLQSGAVRCTSASTGVTCLADGKGFRISRSGVTPASA